MTEHIKQRYSSGVDRATPLNQKTIHACIRPDDMGNNQELGVSVATLQCVWIMQDEFPLLRSEGEAKKTDTQTLVGIRIYGME